MGETLGERLKVISQRRWLLPSEAPFRRQELGNSVGLVGGNVKVWGVFRPVR
jgi:hypothetical protein